MFTIGKNVYQILVTGIFLSVCAFTDLRKHCIYQNVSALAAIFAAIGHLTARDMGMAGGLTAMLPGICCFMISLLTKEELGYGDSLAITVCGFSLGAEKIIGLLMGGFFLAALWAAGLCVFRGANRKKEIPLMPFLLLSFVIQEAGTL